MSDDLLTPAVAETIAKLGDAVRPEDAAVVRLVQRYAAAIDEAQQIALLAALVEPEDVPTAKALAALRQRIDGVTVLADLGPKLAAALESLGATPKARAAFARKGGDTPDKPTKLAQLRAARDGQRRPPAVDAPAS